MWLCDVYFVQVEVPSVFHLLVVVAALFAVVAVAIVAVLAALAVAVIIACVVTVES